MEIRRIDTGYFYADGGAMFGAVPKSAWMRRYPSDERNRCVLAMRSLVVQLDDGRVMLIDTGAGEKHLQQLSYYAFFNQVDLQQALSSLGISADQVTDVVFTDLHFDHCGYATHPDGAGGYRLAFPKARHWVSRRQWENFCTPHPWEAASYFPEDMQAVAETGQLCLIDADESLGAGVTLRLYDGHTPGQLVPYLQRGEETFVFAGDVIPLLASVSLEWISAYDGQPMVSYEAKQTLLEEAARERQRLIFCHDAYQVGATVRKVKDFYVKDQLIVL